MSDTFFSSDTHFCHFNIIRYCNRPYSNVEEMNEALIQNWNTTVKDDDVIWFLGDFSFCGSKYMKSVFARLQGKKHLIRGNHDNKNTYKLGWNSVSDYYELVIKKRQLIIMSHYPMASWNKMSHGSIMLHGHSHGHSLPADNRLDVGVDCWNYTPVSLDTILDTCK